MVPIRKNFLSAMTRFRKGFSGRELGPELVGRISIRVDLASQCFPRRREGEYDLRELGIVDDHHVEIAATPLVPRATEP